MAEAWEGLEILGRMSLLCEEISRMQDWTPDEQIHKIVRQDGHTEDG